MIAKLSFGSTLYPVWYIFAHSPNRAEGFGREHESISGTCGAVGLEGSSRGKKLRANCCLTFAASHYKRSQSACSGCSVIARHIAQQEEEEQWITNNLRRHNRVTAI